MGRLGANSGPSQQGGQHHQPPQEYHFQTATQSPETIDDAPPPPFETSNDENQQEISEENGRPKKAENAHLNQQAQSRPTPSRGPMAFPPQNTQMRSPPSGHQPQAFPPSQDEPQGFPPASQDKPQAFPPPQDKPQAFPPSQAQLQAFPPPQDHQAQAFPPPQDPQPQAFPPPQDHQAQPFPPPQDPQPQAFPPPQDHQAQPFPPPQDHQAQAFPQPQGQPQTFATPAMSSPNVNSHQGINTPIPGFPMAQVLPTQTWQTSLFGCMDNPTNALITLCFPCVTFGQIAEIVDSGQTSCGTSGMLYGLISCLIGMPCLLSCTYRTKIRGRFGIMESAPDWIIHCCCECCALCQEYRELQKRGIDPSIGWLGNVAKSQQMVQLGAMTPPMRQTMMV